MIVSILTQSVDRSRICLVMNGGIIVEIKYNIPDDKVSQFSEGAKRKLQEEVVQYTLEVIGEAEKAERQFRENGAAPEITETSVLTAVRRNKPRKKKNIWVTILRILAEVFLFVAGLMFLPDSFVTADGAFNIGYFAAFAIVALIALIATIVSHFMEGE